MGWERAIEADMRRAERYACPECSGPLDEEGYCEECLVREDEAPPCLHCGEYVPVGQRCKNPDCGFYKEEN